jgi:hypothetical protein
MGLITPGTPKISVQPFTQYHDNEGFSIAKIITTSFLTRFDILKPPIGLSTNTFSKNAPKKLQIPSLTFTL